MIGGIPASPEAAAVASAMATFAATLDRMYDRIADWTERQSLAPASAAGISLIFGICAAVWLTAGTRPGNLYGAIALAAGYLVALGSREFLSPAQFQPADFAAAEVAGASIPAGLVAGTGAARSGWLAMLGTRLSEYAVYVGLAVGATAEGWHGVWPLTIAVLGLAAVCDTMTVCSAAGRPAPGRSAPGRPASKDAGVDDTIPDVPAWEGTAPDVVLPAGSTPPAGAAPTAPHDDLPRPGDPRHDGEPEHLGVGGMVGRVLLTALGMPPGGRVLLIALAAPVFGAQPTLVGLLDWGIIGVGYGIGSRTAARHRDRDRTADRDDQDDPAPAGARAEQGGLAMLLQPARPAEIAVSPEPPPEEPQVPVVRIAPSPSGTVPDPVGKLLGSVADLPVPELAGPDGAAPDPSAPDPATADRGASQGAGGDSDLDRAAYASELTAAAAFENAAFAGEPSIGPTFGLAYTDETGAAQHVADPARRIPGGPPGRQSPVGEPQAGGLSLGRVFGDPAGSPGGAGAQGPDDDAVYDWADDGWPDGGILEDQAGGQPADALGTSAPGPRGADARGADARGADARGATDAELADQDEWDAELAADPQLSDHADPGTQAELADYPPRADYPTLAERLGLGRRPEPSDAADPDADLADTAEYADRPAGSAAALAGQPGAPEASSAAWPAPGAGPPGSAAVLRNRDDGTLARWFGSLVRGQLMPLPPALLALAAVAMLAHLGLRDLPGLLILAPALVMLVAAPGASHRHDGRFDWLAPAVLQGAQYVYIAALGFAAGVPAPITFLLCATVALHYADLGSAGSPILLGVRRAGSPQVARRRRRPVGDGTAARPGRPRRTFQQRLGQTQPGQPAAKVGGQAGADAGPSAGQPAGDPPGGPAGDRPGRPAGSPSLRPQPGAPQPPATELGMWMGWEGRMIAVGLGAAMGVAMFAYLALAGYVSWMICCKVRASYLGLREGDVR